MTSQKIIKLEGDALIVRLKIDEGRVFLTDIHPVGSPPEKIPSPFFACSALPLVEVRLAGEGIKTSKSSKTLIGGYVGTRLQYSSHQEHTDGTSKTLNITTEDPVSKVSVTSHLTIYSGIPVLRSSATICNNADNDVVVTQLSSLVAGGLTHDKEWHHNYVLSTANNTWFREAQWTEQSLASIGLGDYGAHELRAGHDASLAHFALHNRGTFSTEGHLPMGLLKRKDGTETWLWQVENNGSWVWDVGDFKDDLYLAASGPRGVEHDWRQRLAPGQSFTSVPAAVCHLWDTPDAAFAALTQYRRCIRRKHADNERLPIIFNDYMNCLMGDPTDEKILALVEPAQKAGAEIFCIDCGWYSDDSNWWDDVGLWEPSKTRFPMGFKTLLATIREKGLIPGVWLEPEVIGVRSIMAARLPYEAFFQRDGQRIVEKGRYQLDYRHPAVIERMDSVVDRIVLEYGVGYFKFDYNINVNQGTDIDSSSPGVGELGHNRAYLDWVNKLYDRYPDLVIESCSSGAQRLDYAMLSVHSLQSTSDQQDPIRYAAIASAMPSATTPEQAASWAYPQPSWDDEKNAITVINSLLGRVHLSGRLDLLQPDQFELVAEGMKLYKEIRKDVSTGLPFWPLGLPAWHDEWVAVGLSTPQKSHCYVAVYHRGGSCSISLPISMLKGQQDICVKLLYPSKFAAEARWDASDASLIVRLPATACGRLFRLSVAYARFRSQI